jgi:hypothetical protein
MKAGWRHRQQGATFLGILIIGGILACGVYAGIRLMPLYVEYFAVERALKQAASQGDESPAGIKRSLEQRWVIEDIKSFDYKNVAITKTGSGTQVRAQYRAEAPFIGNVSLVVDFDTTVTIGGGGRGI